MLIWMQSRDKINCINLQHKLDLIQLYMSLPPSARCDIVLLLPADGLISIPRFHTIWFTLSLNSTVPATADNLAVFFLDICLHIFFLLSLWISPQFIYTYIKERLYICMCMYVYTSVSLFSYFVKYCTVLQSRIFSIQKYI